MLSSFQNMYWTAPLVTILVIKVALSLTCFERKPTTLSPLIVTSISILKYSSTSSAICSSGRIRTLRFLSTFFTKPMEAAKGASDENIDACYEKINKQDESILENSIKFAQICGKLKTTPRTGWVYSNVPDPESVADHSWRVAALCLLLREQDQHGRDTNTFNISKAIEMAIVHDLAESIVGDIAPADNVTLEEKYKLEHDAITYIAKILSGATNTKTDDSSTSNKSSETAAATRLLSLWKEYEERETNTAIAVKDLDLLDMLIQAAEYEEKYQHLDLQQFFDSTPVEKFQTVKLRNIAEEIHNQRTRTRDLNNKRIALENVTKIQHPPLSLSDAENISKAEPPMLSESDAAFVQKFIEQSSTTSSTIGLSKSDVERVVQSLRLYEQNT